MTDFESIPEPPAQPSHLHDEHNAALEPDAPPPHEPDPSGAVPPTSAAESASKDAWGDVVQSLDDLGRAVTSWAKTATDSAENRLRAAHLKEQLEKAGRQMGDAVDSASKSDFAQHVGKAASGTGEVILDAARKFSEDVGPHIAGAFISAAEGVMSVGRKRPSEAGAAAEAGATPSEPVTHPGPSPEAAPYEENEEPPAPAPSGTPDDYTP